LKKLIAVVFLLAFRVTFAGCPDPPRIRGTSYVFVGKDGPRGGGSCDIAQNWPDCLTEFADAGDAPATTCQTTIDLGTNILDNSDNDRGATQAGLHVVDR
jgi:hypothetical protein